MKIYVFQMEEIKHFEMCTGEYIVCLDDDAVVITKDFLRKYILKWKNMMQ